MNHIELNGHKINNGEKIVYVRQYRQYNNAKYFNPLTSEKDAAEIYAISWLESQAYSDILYYASLIEETEE